MATATQQALLAKILTNRINAEATAKTLSDDTDISNILDIFVAAEKVTLDEYNTLTALISSSTSDTTTN